MSEKTPEPDPGRAGRRGAGTDRSPWMWLLAVPVLLLIYPPLYNRDAPELGGLPFFYWYQLAVVPVGVICTVIVYLRTRGDRGGER